MPCPDIKFLEVKKHFCRKALKCSKSDLPNFVLRTEHFTVGVDCRLLCDCAVASFLHCN